MVKKPFFTVLLIVILSLASALAEAKKKTVEMQVVIVGDSHVEALGPRLQKILGTSRNEPHRSTMAATWLDHPEWGNRIAGLQPDFIIMVFGTNEAQSKTGSENMAGDVYALAKRLSAGTKAKVVLVTPPQLDRAPYMPAVREAATRLGRSIQVVDFSQKKYPLKDGVHLTPEAYDLWLDDIISGISWR